MFSFNNVLGRFKSELLNTWDVPMLMIFSIIIPWIILHSDGLTAYGEYQKLILICTLAEPIVMIGAMPKLLLAHAGRGDIKMSRFDLRVVVAFWLAAAFIGFLLGYLYLALVIYSDVLRSVLVQILIIQERFFFSSIMRIGSSVVLMIGLLWGVGATDSFFYSNLCAISFGLIVYLKNNKLKFDQEEASWFSFGQFWYLCSKVFRANVDKVGVGSFFSTDIFAMYQLAGIIVTHFKKISSRLGQVHIANIFSKGRSENGTAILVLVGFGYLLAASVSEVVIRLIYSQEVPSTLPWFLAILGFVQYAIGNTAAHYVRSCRFNYLASVFSLTNGLCLFGFWFFNGFLLIWPVIFCVVVHGLLLWVLRRGQDDNIFLH